MRNPMKIITILVHNKKAKEGNAFYGAISSNTERIFDNVSRSTTRHITAGISRNRSINASRRWLEHGSFLKRIHQEKDCSTVYNSS